ncbi:EAL domain-containing protein [Pedomonas mirosovicensis]|uniref:EAL domain-containing protein n=1 Tax=Pedomonas mirosovicensis TaxID=2908641 RepID=UPI00216722D8|nr:EAL domain-containing protein [Pedomonas mirosovicensis]MCH8684874.1 EAL domain-containing protein [Pedomonas mirosovicensis]
MHPLPYRTITALVAYALAGGLTALAGLSLAGLDVTTALLLGLGVVGAAFLLHLIAGILGERRRMIAWVTEQDRLLPELDERLLRVERNVTAMLSDLTAEQSRKTADLAAELSLLRLMMERLAGDMRQAGVASDAASGALAAVGKGQAGRDIAALLRSALKESRVDLYLQPIVRLPSRKVMHYEALSRLRDEKGRVFTPSDYLDEAAEAGLVSLLDNLLLFRSINLIRKLGPRRPGVRLFCNMSAGSLTDETFLAELVEFLEQQRELADRLVFEFSAGDLAQLPEAAIAQLAELARVGFAFSIDNVTDMAALDLARLARLNVRFLKMDAEIYLSGPISYVRAVLAETLERHGMTLIVTRIETDRTVAEVLELGAAYGQGYLFGSPRPGRGVAVPPSEMA